MKKIILIVILVVAILVGYLLFGGKGDSNVSNVVTPTSIEENSAEDSESSIDFSKFGIVSFNQGEVSVELDLNEMRDSGREDVIEIYDSVMIGKVGGMKLSPSEKFLYFATGQGGGYAQVLYDIEKDRLHLLNQDNVTVGGSVGEWTSDDKLEFTEHGGEGDGFIDREGRERYEYISVSSETPWILKIK